MSEPRLRVGVVGCGTQGRVHLEAYRRRPDVEIAALCDLDGARLEAAGRDFGVGRLYADFGEMLSAGRLDLVSVATMPATHLAVTTAALEAGAHVLCEKPMALNADEAERMVAVARDRRRTLTVGFNMRWMGSARFARSHVAAGRLGRPQYARVWALANDVPWWGKHYQRSLSGGGVLASTAVHVLDLTLWVMGHPGALAVSASTLRRFPERRGATAPDAAAAASYDVEDLISAHVRLEGGAALTLEAAWAYDALRSDYGFELTGSQGLLRFDPLTVVTERDGRAVDATPEGVADTDWPSSVGREIDDVVEAVRRGRSPLVTAEQALAVQRLTDALYESASAGREVRLDGRGPAVDRSASADASR
jgi:predicted dehydrogenase